jgi:ABC-type dipeptide/oligopeptide/nickel transport system permease subunit
MGTDAFGRDMLARVLYGARLAVKVSLSTTVLASVLGIVLGLIAGYHQGRWNQVLSRIFDVWMAFPGLLLAVVIVAWLGPSLNSAIFALAIISVPAFFRLARSSALTESNHLYVEAARSIGASDRRIILRHLLPNITSPLIVLASLTMGMALLAVSGLTFIGLGAQPPTPEWGALLAAGRDAMDTAWWLSVFPGLAITLSVMGFNLFGDGLRDALATESSIGE